MIDQVHETFADLVHLDLPSEEDRRKARSNTLKGAMGQHGWRARMLT